MLLMISVKGKMREGEGSCVIVKEKKIKCTLPHELGGHYVGDWRNCKFYEPPGVPAVALLGPARAMRSGPLEWEAAGWAVSTFFNN